MNENIKFKNLEIKSADVDEDKREFTCIITDSSIDRDGDVLLPSGMNKKDYEKKNPIILFNHNQDTPIGTAVSLRRSGEGWVAKGRLATGIEHIDTIWKLMKQNVLKSVSVGFMVDEMRPPTKQDISDFGKGLNGKVISKWTLVEFSVVSVGSNTNALVTAVKNLDLDPKDFIPDYEEVETIEEIVEKQIEELEIEVKDTTKEEIIEVVKEKKVNMDEVMKYFREEVAREIRKSKGMLFKD